MERKQDEQARKIKELQSHVERPQLDNDQLQTKILESREPGRVIIKKASFKSILYQIFAIADLQSPDGAKCPIRLGMANAQLANKGRQCPGKVQKLFNKGVHRETKSSRKLLSGKTMALCSPPRVDSFGFSINFKSMLSMISQ